MQSLREALDVSADTDLDEYARDELGLAKTETLLDVMASCDPKPTLTTTPWNGTFIIKPIEDETNRHIIEMKMQAKTAKKCVK